MKKVIALILVAAAAGGGYFLWQRWQEQQDQANNTDRPTTAVAEVRDIRFTVNAAGEITPAEQVSVKPEINGRIEVLPVDLGDKVKQGDLLFKLDDKELQQQRASTLTDISRSRLELEKADRDLKRAEQLLKENLISQELYDDTRTTWELAKVALERSQKDLALVEERLTKTEVRAPFDCTVLTRPVSIGQAVSGSGGFNSGTEVLSIADLNSMIINAHVNQADVPRLRAGQSVEVLVEAVAGLQITGEVERIAPQATIKNNIKGYAARIVLKDVDPRVRPGMTANIKIPVASAENVTAVPISAVYTEKDESTGLTERYVYVQAPTGYEKRLVKVGVSDYFYAEIEEGLDEGEVVALELPKEERDRKAKELVQRTNNGGVQGVRKGSPQPATKSTNAPSPTRATVTTSAESPRPAASAPVDRTGAASAGSRSSS